VSQGYKNMVQEREKEGWCRACENAQASAAAHLTNASLHAETPLLHCLPLLEGLHTTDDVRNDFFNISISYKSYKNS
jgi:hypothetical protein